ncbi:LacI family transcriptional regulator [Labilibacter sediminis]|nr:LacI family transcriptional regulator [Labilibacter sediminis]
MAKISINKIAELAGVSKTTVSFVLNGRGDEKNISLKTQEKIIGIAKSHNYQANYVARSLSMGKSYTIGFVVPDISNPFYGKIARYIEQYAEEKGYSVMVASTGEDIKKERKILNELKARQIDGVILASASPNASEIKQTSSGNLPTVYFDRVFLEQQNLYVDINNSESSSQLTQLLINKGHKRIGLISLSSYLPNIKQRISGYKNTLENEGIELDSELIVDIDLSHKKESIKQALEHLLQMENPATAILFLNNVLAANGIWAINNYYPEQTDKLLFASFDNLDLFDYSKPKVVSALQPNNEIAKHCINMLCKQIDDSEESEGIQLKTTIINR